MSNPHNIILTGIPRSGTTLACHLLNKLPNFVALHEPMLPSKYFGLDIDTVVATIDVFFSKQRESIEKTGTAKSKSVLNTVPDNHIGRVDDLTGKRQNLIDGDRIFINKALSQNFYLVIKHPNIFTAILENLKTRFICFSVIRNPIAILLSWNSVNMPVSNGRAPAAEAFDTQLSEMLNLEKSKYVRQIILLEWFFKKYNTCLNPKQIIKYEDIVKTGGKALSVISDTAEVLSESLKSKNSSFFYDNSIKKILTNLLLEYNGCYLDFYDKNEIYDPL